MTKITFSVGTKYVGSTVKETFDLEDDLGIVREDYSSDESFEKGVQEAYNEWLWNTIDAYWDIED